MMFQDKLLTEITRNLNNNFSDNFDYFRFGQPGVTEKNGVAQQVRKKLVKAIYRTPYKHRRAAQFIKENIADFHINKLSEFYNSLDNARSKELLIQLLAYRILGHRKVRLPLSTPAFWEAHQTIEQLQQDEYIPIKFHDWKLKKTDLSSLGYPIQLYYIHIGIFMTFWIKQYEYQLSSKDCIKAKAGDVVLDLGGCFGDTALYFAHEVGAEGAVYTFEFIPANLEVMRRNVALNPALAKRINIVENPVWSQSNKKVYFHDNGPGSQVSFEKSVELEGQTSTIAVDDFVRERGLEQVNFIKMDIEGAEPNALIGAEHTIKTFKPNLAIAIYHSMDDFVGIIDYLKKLNLGYKFFIGHYTIHLEETVLYATTQV